MVGLATVCGVDLIARHLIEYGASVGFKLLRAGALSGFSSQEIYDTAIVGVRSTVPPVPSQASGLSWAEAKMLTLERDSADEVLVRLLPGANPDVLLSAAAARNFGTTCALLAERGADIHFVEVRRGRRRGLVDMAARAAGLDGDWRLVAWLLRCGARPEAPTGVIFSPLRRGEISLARQLVQLGVRPCKSGLVSLLCDVCAHGATEAAAMLIDELDVPVNALNARDGDSCTDRALAWHCWDTAEWLVVAKGGIPAKPDSALGHLLDASGDPVAARVLGVMRAKGLLGTHSLLEAAVQRGDLALVEELLAATSTWLPRSFAMDCGLMTLPGRGLTCRCTQAAPATALQPRSWPCCPRRRPPSPCCQRRPRGVGLPHSATGTWSRRTTAPQPSPPPPGTPSSASSRACCHPSMPSPAAPPSPRTKRRWHRWHFPPADRSSRCPSG
uniref:Uncharacterized protein n=1 Tax=Alexandrium monilatum TaxID=311494 RepID=A0A7S4Q277_9DINO